MRELAGKKAKEMRSREKSLAAITPEVLKQRARSLSERRLAHIPPEFRDDYRALVRVKVPRDEAAAMIRASYEARMREFRAKIRQKG